MGPGMRENFIIEGPIRHVDQYMTIMTLMGKKSNHDVDGVLLNDILK